MSLDGRNLVEKLSLEEIHGLLNLNELFISAFTKIVLVFNASKKVEETTPVIFPLNKDSTKYFMEVSLVQNKETNNQAIKVALVKLENKSH